jgi:anti-sigma regulatory factor (Ser/Thr protein kinase)
VTELVTNSVRHARAREVELRIDVRPRSVFAEVSDEGPGFEPRPRQEGDDERSGWGLFLIERLASRWGVRRAADKTLVWFELRRAMRTAGA